MKSKKFTPGIWIYLFSQMTLGRMGNLVRDAWWPEGELLSNEWIFGLRDRQSNWKLYYDVKVSH